MLGDSPEDSRNLVGEFLSILPFCIFQVEHLGHFHSKLVLRCEVLFYSSRYLLPECLFWFCFVLCFLFFVFFIVLLLYRSCEIYALRRFYFGVFQGFVSRSRAPFSSSCSADLVVANSFSIYLSGKDCIFPSFMKLSFARYKILG